MSQEHRRHPPLGLLNSDQTDESLQAIRRHCCIGQIDLYSTFQQQEKIKVLYIKHSRHQDTTYKQHNKKKKKKIKRRKNGK